MKILPLLREGTVQLEAAGISGARFEADLLLAAVLGLTRPELYGDFERVLSAAELRDYQGLLKRRQKREPLQYILQRQEFMGLEFYVDERVLIPRADSEILAEKLLALLDKEPEKTSPRILDLCTGSGALAIAIASYCPRAQVVGTDLSALALEVAAANATRLGVQVEWRQGDFLCPAAGELWDWIVTNPPYVSAQAYKACQPEIFFEPEIAFLGGEDGLDFYRRLALEAPPLLNKGGRLLMEIGWDQGRTVQEIFAKEGYKTMLFPDLAQRDRVVLVE